MPDEAADKKPTIKPGYKTTEFWISLAAVIIGSVVASGIVPADSVW